MKTKNINKEIKKACHAEKLLLSISRLLGRYRFKTTTNNGKKGGPELQPFRTTTCFNNAFTLIELLVVVLIIGILAAVAVPQYQKAVEKSRAAEAIQLLKNLRDAQALCLLEHGAESSACAWGEGGSQGIGELFDNISISIPGTIEASAALDGDGIKTKDFLYGLVTVSGLEVEGAVICAERENSYTICTTAFPGTTHYYNQLICQSDEEGCNAIGFQTKN